MSFKITADNLRRIAGGKGNPSVIDALVEHLPEVMDKYNIDTLNRAAHFLGQLAHESDHFNTFEEYASGDEYEGRRDLGNLRKGDGVRFKGRGVIQITGRANYQRLGDILGVDLVNNPELAATPKISVLTALEYWKQRKINTFADRDDIRLVTRAINGGFNGLDDRLASLNRAKQALKTIETIDKAAPAPKKPKPEPVVTVEKIEQPNTNTIIEVVETVANTSNDIPMFVEIDLTNQ